MEPSEINDHLDEIRKSIEHIETLTKTSSHRSHITLWKRHGCYRLALLQSEMLIGDEVAAAKIEQMKVSQAQYDWFYITGEWKEILWQDFSLLSLSLSRSC